MDQMFFKLMGGGTKAEMKKRADEHFNALRQIVPEVKRLMLFDYDDKDKAFHPEPNDLALAEWKRKNIENYLLVPEAWKRAALRLLNCGDDDLFVQSALDAINTFFVDQNLTLASGKTWRNVSADIFSVVNGKRILFENDTSLFHALRNGNPSVELIRESVAAAMTEDEIHEDVHGFFFKLRAMVK
jgi:hypothetical protein